MNIGINARHLIEHKLEGIGWYSFEILNRMVQLRPDDHFYFYYDRKIKPLVEGKNITNVIVYPSARSPHLFRFWFVFCLFRCTTPWGLCGSGGCFCLFGGGGRGGPLCLV